MQIMVLPQILLKLFKNTNDANYTFNKIKKQLSNYHYDAKDIKEALDSLRKQGIIYYYDEADIYKPFPADYRIGKIEYSKKGFYSIRFKLWP